MRILAHESPALCANGMCDEASNQPVQLWKHCGTYHGAYPVRLGVAGAPAWSILLIYSSVQRLEQTPGLSAGPGSSAHYW
jgi:hypothetical protein